MADDKETTETKPTLRKRYRNRTKVEQTFYLKTGQGVSVLAGGTIILDDEIGEKYAQHLEPVNYEDGSPIKAPKK